jgi:hypothetical protein
MPQEGGEGGTQTPEYYEGLGLNGLPELDAVRSADNCCDSCVLELSAVIVHLLLDVTFTGLRHGRDVGSSRKWDVS